MEIQGGRLAMEEPVGKAPPLVASPARVTITIKSSHSCVFFMSSRNLTAYAVNNLSNH
jgi:predicted chitinase